MKECLSANMSCLRNIKWCDVKCCKKSIAIGVGALVVLITAWVFVKYQRSADTERAALVYDTVLAGFQNRDKETVKTYAVTLVEKFPKTVYAQFGAMVLARVALEDQDLEKAAKHLQFASDHHGPIKNIAISRLARLLIAQQKYTDALRLLEKAPKEAPYTALYEEAKGDAYVAQNMLDKARTAYQASVAAMPPEIPIPLLQMKITDIPPPLNAQQKKE